MVTELHLYSFSNQWTLKALIITILPNVHPFMHTSMAVSTTQGDSQLVSTIRVSRLAQGHLNPQPPQSTYFASHHLITDAYRQDCSCGGQRELNPGPLYICIYTVLVLTGALCAGQRQALVAAADGVQGHQVLGLGLQGGQGVAGPAGRKALLLGPLVVHLLVAQPVAADRGRGRHPVDGEGTGGDLGEVQTGGGVQGWAVWEGGEEEVEGREGEVGVTPPTTTNVQPLKEQLFSLSNSLVLCVVVTGSLSRSPNTTTTLMWYSV